VSRPMRAMDDDRLMPWCRATIAGDAVTLNPWTPQLIRGGPAAMSLAPLEATGVALADLYAEGEPGEEELVVRYVAPSPRPQDADAALVAWARTVGYRRVWLPEAVVDLDVAGAPVGAAATACPTCGLTWRDESPEFWRGVRRAGAFPGWCPACGGSLPEWRVVAAAPTGAPGTQDLARSGRR
jgi:hypothetical protein